MSIQREELTFPSTAGKGQIYGAIFTPTGPVKAVVQFAPGMSDYGGRYQHVFNYLAEHGYVAAYNDHLGHGKSAAAESDLGFFAPQDGYQKVIGDFNKFYDILGAKYPTAPHFVMGHSMGSFIVRNFLASGKSDGAIIMGSGSKNSLAGLGIFLAGLLSKLQGERHHSRLLAHMAFGTYNKRIEDSDHQWAWLSTEPSAQERILEDELRNKLFTTSAFKDLFKLVKYANDAAVIDKTPHNLPLVFISGADDPLGPYGAGIEGLYKVFQGKGFTNVTRKIIPNARHELCHERPEVQAEVLAFILQWLDLQVETQKNKNLMGRENER